MQDPLQKRLWAAILRASEENNIPHMLHLCCAFQHGRNAAFSSDYMNLRDAGMLDVKVKCVQTHYGMAL